MRYVRGGSAPSKSPRRERYARDFPSRSAVRVSRIATEKMSSPLWRRERGSAPSVADRADPAVTGAATAGRADGEKGLPHTGQLAPEARERGFTCSAAIISCTWPRGESQVELLRRKKSHWWGAWLIAPGERSSPNATMSFPRRPDERRPSTRNSRSGCRRPEARLAVPANRILASAVRFHDRGGGGRASRAGECAGHDDGGYDQRVGVRRDEGADPSNVHRCRVGSFCFS